MSKKVTVLGANGYIARNLIYSLDREDVELKLYDRQDAHLDGHAGYAPVDVLSKESMAKVDLDCDVIYMLVGKTGTFDGFDNFDMYVDVNEKALLNLLNTYRAQNSRAKIVFPSTRLVYDNNSDAKENEVADSFKTIYAVNKYSCEKILEMYHRVFGVKYLTLRLCVPYGTMIEGASSYGTAEFMLGKAKAGEDITLYDGGQVKRTLTYMGDLCRVLIRAAFEDKCVNDVYNIGGECYSLKEMASLIADMYGIKTVDIDAPESARLIESGDTVFNSEKLDAILGDDIYQMRFKTWVETCK